MQTKIMGRHMEVTEALRNYAEKKLARLDKFSRISDIEVIFDNEGVVHKVEIIVKAGSRQRFVVSHTEEDAYACLDAAIDKMDRQLIKDKEKSRNHKGRTGAAEATAEVIEAHSSEEEESIE